MGYIYIEKIYIHFLNFFISWLYSIVNKKKLYIHLLTDYQLLKLMKSLIFTNRGDHLISQVNLFTLKITIILEACKRLYLQNPKKNQVISAILLLYNSIIESNTGEGKTLSLIIASLYQSLHGKQVHIITSNLYLASRDSSHANKILNFFNLKSFVLSENKKNRSLNCVYYGSPGEFIFNFLNSKLYLDSPSLKFDSLMIDEIDDILFDVANTPFIISNPGNTGHRYNNILLEDLNTFILNLSSDDININLSEKKIKLSSEGKFKLKKQLYEKNNLSHLTLYQISNQSILQIIDNLLHAHYFLKRNIDYIIKHKKIYLLDINTGRPLENHNLSHGLHQALEIKENLPTTPQSNLSLSMNLNEYISQYNHFSGITGTIGLVKEEISNLYNLFDYKVQSQIYSKNLSFNNIYFKSNQFDYLLKIILFYQRIKKPILINVSNSKKANSLFKFITSNKLIKDYKINLLVSKNLNKEIEIINNSGNLKELTISTNIIGRGTDISLGNDNFSGSIVKMIGGLSLISLDFKDSYRLSRQIQGRSSRQKDPGSSQFLLSYNDLKKLKLSFNFQNFYNEKLKNLKLVFFNEKLSSYLIKNQFLIDFNKSKNRISLSIFEKIKNKISINIYNKLLEIKSYGPNEGLHFILYNTDKLLNLYLINSKQKDKLINNLSFITNIHLSKKLLSIDNFKLIKIYSVLALKVILNNINIRLNINLILLQKLIKKMQMNYNYKSNELNYSTSLPDLNRNSENKLYKMKEDINSLLEEEWSNFKIKSIIIFFRYKVIT